MSLQNSQVEILIASVMVLGGGAFRRCLGHESRRLLNEITALIKQTPASSLTPSIM